MKKIKIMLVLLLLPLQLLVSKPVIAEPTEIIPPTPITFEGEIQRIFGNKSNIAFAVFKHESNAKITSKNWNCVYNGRSTFCKKEDRIKAWSVDCGYFQINVRGLVCPTEYMDKLTSLKRVEEIYKQQGLNAWVSYKTGAYKKYL